MVHGANKSGSRRKKHVRARSATVERYEERKPGKPTCVCGRPLQGTARGKAATLAKMSKTQKRPSRPFGGNLCAVCTKQVFRDQARLSQE